MARYVMANRRAGKFLDDEKRASRAALAASFDQLFAANVNVIADRDPQDELARRVVLFEPTRRRCHLERRDCQPTSLSNPRSCISPVCKRLSVVQGPGYSGRADPRSWICQLRRR